MLWRFYQKFMKMNFTMWIKLKFQSFIYHVSVQSNMWYTVFNQMIACTSKFDTKSLYLWKNLAKVLINLWSRNPWWFVSYTEISFIKIWNVATNTCIMNKLRNIYTVYRSKAYFYYNLWVNVAVCGLNPGDYHKSHSFTTGWMSMLADCYSPRLSLLLYFHLWVNDAADVPLFP